MAAFYEEGLDREELREAFDAAKAKGCRHLLVLREVAHNVLLSEARTLTASVRHQAEIVHTLRRLNEYSALGINVELTGVYDLSADFDHQASFSGEDQLKRTLSFPVRAELESYEKEQHVPLPDTRAWYKRWFNPQ